VVCDRATALDNLEKRRASVLAAFSGCTGHWDFWQTLVERTTADYFKVDATEIWDLDPNAFELDFPAAVRWFASGNVAGLDNLLALGALSYDPELRRLTIGDSEVKGEHLYGYPMTATPPPAPRLLPPQPPPPLPTTFAAPTPPPLPPPLPPNSKKPWWKLS
jgi:hypothetical protein